MKITTKIISLLICISLILAITPLGATAIRTCNLYVGGVEMYDGDYLAVGATSTQTTKPAGGYAYYKDGVLTLSHYTYEGKGYEFIEGAESAVIFAATDLEIMLEGVSDLVQTSTYGDVIATEGSIKFCTSSDGELGLGGDYGIYAMHSDSANTISVESGTVEIYATYAAVYSSGARIELNGGVVNIVSVYDGISVYESDLVINGGYLNISAGAHSVYLSDSTLYLNGGNGNLLSTDPEWDEDCAAIYLESDISEIILGEDIIVDVALDPEGESTKFNMMNLAEYDRFSYLTECIYVGGVLMNDGDYLANDATATQTAKPTGGYAYYKDDILTLNNYVYNGKGVEYMWDGDMISSAICAYKELTIVLNGVNLISQTEDSSEGITAFNGLTIKGTGTLKVFSDIGISVLGGNLTFESGEYYIKSAGYGIYCTSEYSELIINGGKFEIISTAEGPGDKFCSSVYVYNGNAISLKTGMIIMGAEKENDELTRYYIPELYKLDHVKIYESDEPISTVVTIEMKTGDSIYDYSFEQSMALEYLVFKGYLAEDEVNMGFADIKGKLLITINGNIITVVDGLTAEDNIIIKLSAEEQELIKADAGIDITEIRLLFVPEEEYIVGDVNGNGKIDARDYLLLKRAYFGTYTLTCTPEAADVNGNGKIDARDYLLLKRAYFGTYTIK